MAIVDKRKRRLIVVVCVPADEHEAETRGVIRRLGLKGVFWRLQHIHIRTSQIINEMQIIEIHILDAEGQGVGAVAFRLEIHVHGRVGVHTVSTMDVNFKAAKNGTYTLTFDVENVNFNYLHLIDNLTGADVDLLTPPACGHLLTEGDVPLLRGQGGFNNPATYTFTAKTTDYESRFKLVFATIGGDANGDNEAPFAFINNGNIIVNGEGTLQVIDVMGRVIVSGDAINRVSTGGMAAGVYVLRLINGDDVRTQRIVVR